MEIAEQPVLTTARLVLRPFNLADAAAVQRLAGAPEVASTTLNIPHPYEDGMAEEWIGTHATQFQEGGIITYAVTLRDEGLVIGVVSLGVAARHRHAELAYWMGLPYWNRGYTTEACAALVEYGFSVLALHRITAMHFTRNTASGRVMQKVGMEHEGTLRQHFLKGDGFEDVEVYGLLAEKWRQSRQPADASETSQHPILMIETDRLRLRRFREQDKTAFLAYRNDPDVARYQSWEVCTDAQATQLIQEMETLPFGLPGRGLQIAIEHKDSGSLAGDCYLQVDGQEKCQAEIGFTLARPYQGQGLAAEAISAVRDYAFRQLNLHRIVAVTDCRNKAATALLERVGFRREGHFLKNVWFKGEWGDEFLYAVLREERLDGRAAFSVS